MKSKYVKVKMLVNTAYQGPRKEGDVVSVPEDFAKRWVKNGIAEYVQKEQETDEPETPVQDDVDETPTTDDIQEQADDSTEDDTAQEGATEDKPDYESMSAKELYALCKEKGIEVEAKKSKEYYIEKLA